MSIYLCNKYHKIYYSLVNRSFERTRPKVCEGHHIVPKCLGGLRNPTNIAYLTPREHFVAHLLLLKITEGIAKSKMAWAINRMRNTKNKYRITSRQYETIRIEFCEAHSKLLKGKGNPMHNKRYGKAPSAKSITFDGIYFSSKKELHEYAKEQYNLSSFSMKKYLKDENVTTFKQCLEILERNNEISRQSGIKAGKANRGKPSPNKGIPSPIKGIPVADLPIGKKLKKRLKTLHSMGIYVTLEELAKNRNKSTKKIIKIYNEKHT